MIMNTNEISGKRQLEFLEDFDYIREAGTAGEEKAAARLLETSGAALAWRAVWKKFRFDTFPDKKGKADN